MKKIDAIIRPHKIDEVKELLMEAGDIQRSERDGAPKGAHRSLQGIGI